jgi:hypothetical protein
MAGVVRGLGVQAVRAIRMTDLVGAIEQQAERMRQTKSDRERAAARRRARNKAKMEIHEDQQWFRARRQMHMLRVDRGRFPSPCPRCCTPIYPSVTQEGKRVDIDCDVPDGRHPTDDVHGLGLSHFIRCRPPTPIRSGYQHHSGISVPGLGR